MPVDLSPDDACDTEEGVTGCAASMRNQDASGSSPKSWEDEKIKEFNPLRFLNPSDKFLRTR
ncbi:MAG: hypothetical protein ABIH46_06635 [Chloroflexota bacterium]